MKALVTGATGFVGSHLLEALRRHGHAARAMVRSPAKAAALGIADVEWAEGDLRDETALHRACEGMDLVFHVAGLIAARSEDEYFAVNRDGTARLLRAAQDARARFVLVSSLAAAGPTTPGRPLIGGEPPRPVTPYGRSKLAAEEVVRGAADQMPWTIIRPPTIYGPRDREMLRIFRAAALGLAPVFGDGSQELSLIYAPDLALALIAAGTQTSTIGKTYFAAHSEIVTTRQLVGRIGAAMGRRVRVVAVPSALARIVLHVTGAVARLTDRPSILSPDKADEFLQPAWTCDPRPLEHDTGWRAEHDLDSGARATIDWYRRCGWLA
jgi:nucleoside-diphosphate-sugar epimerase